MRILHITPSYKPADGYGGPIISVGRLAEEQVKAGAEVWVFTTTANGSVELPVPAGTPQDVDGVLVRYFKRWTGDHGHFSPALLWAVWREVRQFQVVQIHSWWNWVVFGAVLACRWRGVRTVVSPHGMLSPYTIQGRMRHFFQRYIGQWLLSKSLLHATSNQESWELQALHPGLPVAVVVPNIVYLPILPTFGGSESWGTPRPFRLLFLSRIDPKKGLDILFQALANLKTAPDWRLTIGGATGSNYQRKMQTLATGLGLAERITWLGWTQGEAKWDLLAQSDLLVLPSHNENFAIAVLEALAAGTPVVVGNQVGLHSYVAENDFGWRTDTEPEALARVLINAIADEEKRRRIRQTAPAKVRADFEPGKVLQKYFDLYRRIGSIDSIGSIS